MNSKNKKNNEENENEINETRLEFIEFQPRLRKPRYFHQPAPQPQSLADPQEIPDFPIKSEFGDDLYKTASNKNEDASRLEFLQESESGDKTVAQQSEDSRSAVKRDGFIYDGPDKMDDSLPEGDYKPWEIILNPLSGEMFGFSEKHFNQWLRKREIRKIEIQCENCENVNTDNPFTGFKQCHYCGSKLQIMMDIEEEIKKIRLRAFIESQKSSVSASSFMTKPLDVPAHFLTELTEPKVDFRLFEYQGLTGPLFAFIVFLAIWLPLFVLTQDINMRLFLIFALTIAFILNINSITNSIGVKGVKLNNDGVRFYRIRSSKFIKYERITSISVVNRRSLYGSIRQANPVLAILMLPFALIGYVFTLGMINLYSIFHENVLVDNGDPFCVHHIEVKTRATSVNIQINRSQQPTVSMLMGILIYRSLVANPNVLVNQWALFAAQKSYNFTI